MKKDQIINLIEKLTPNELFLAIYNGEITFQELRATGKLNSQKQKEIQKLLEKSMIKGNEEVNDWEKVIQKSDAEALKKYIQKYPSGNYVAIAKAKILELKEAENQPSTFKKFWNDPVFSKISASFILALLTFIISLIGEGFIQDLFSKKEFTTESLTQIGLVLGIIIATVIVIWVILFLVETRKKKREPYSQIKDVLISKYLNIIDNSEVNPNNSI